MRKSKLKNNFNPRGRSFAIVILAAASISGEAISQTSVLIPYRAHSASSSFTPITNVSDANPSTAWNSGGPAPAWIQLDLNRNVVPSRVRLHTEQYPPGNVTHTITGVLSNGATVNLASYAGYMSNSVWLEINIPYSIPVRYLRIATSQSSSWVAWKDIEVIEGGDLKKNCGIETGPGIVGVGTEYQSKCSPDGRYFIFRDLSQQPYGTEVFSCQGWNLPPGWTLVSTNPGSQTQCSNYDTAIPLANRKIYTIRNNNLSPIKEAKPDAYDTAPIPAIPSRPNPSGFTWPTDMREFYFNK